MACNCKHNQEQIDEQRKAIIEFGHLFFKRMTEDSPHQDRRRKDYNQALFHYDEDTDRWYQVWNEITPDMVMQCFSDALDDWRRTWCDSPNCRRD